MGQMNKVADALRRKILTIQEIQLQGIGIEEFKDPYKGDANFSEIHKVCNEFDNHFHSEYANYN